MLRAKRLGGARHEVFDQALREHLLQQVDLEASLSLAVERAELEVHFQPTIDLTTGQVRGAEALVRWRRGETWVSPEVFIPVAERSGLIVRVGEFVLRTACERLAGWLAEGLLSDDFVLAVNIAPRQVSQPGFAEQIDGILRDTGVEPPRLCLELTETALIDDPDTAADTLTALRGRGIAIAVDDFGTGQSSLTYLRRFPIEMVKVDRSFVGGLPTDPADTAIVGSVVELGRRLGLTTLAEGVETQEQADMLRGMGCQLAQGFFFSRALPGAALVDWVGRHDDRSPNFEPESAHG
jgi:EAL domain-containing protein (putative c-di-GMP-specific phosphodiesterase class I)